MSNVEFDTDQQLAPTFRPAPLGAQTGSAAHAKRSQAVMAILAAIAFFLMAVILFRFYYQPASATRFSVEKIEQTKQFLP